MTGIVEVPLRPTGKAVIDGKLIEVVAVTGFVDVGAQVRVIKEDGSRALVEEV
jgi:membrane-bound serine protease (ClpP class)